MKEAWKGYLRGLPAAAERAFALVRHVIVQFNRDQGLVSAGMLTYATLLSLVPFMTVVVSIAAALPGASDWSDRIQEFAFSNFVPAARETIQQKLGELTASARGVTAAMGFFLVVTSIILMHNIESTINRTFGVQQERSWSNRFMVYWSALTLGPVLLGASLALSSYFFSLRFFAEVESVGWLVQLIRSVSPVVVSALAFFLIFAVVPNRRVSIVHAAIGAVITAILFEIAKKAFGFYVATFEGYERLYGALAAIPIFLVWIYLSWSLILFGASLTASLNTLHLERPRRGWPREREFLLLFRILGHLWQAHQEGRSLSDAGLSAREPEASDEQLARLLENLRAGGILTVDHDGDWLLRRDLAKVSVRDLYKTGTYAWPTETRGLGDEPAWVASFTSLVADADRELEPLLERSLAELLAHGGEPSRKRPVAGPVQEQGEERTTAAAAAAGGEDRWERVSER